MCMSGHVVLIVGPVCTKFELVAVIGAPAPSVLPPAVSSAPEDIAGTAATISAASDARNTNLRMRCSLSSKSGLGRVVVNDDYLRPGSRQRCSARLLAICELVRCIEGGRARKRGLLRCI